MKVDQRGLIQTSTGTEGPVRLTLEDEDDVWMLVSLLTIGDSLKAVTTRKVAVGSGSEMDRKKLSMAIKITKIDYEFGAQSAIRVSGTNLTESEWVMLGQFHTHIVSVGSDVTLTKSDWDSQHLATLATLAEQQCSGDLAVVLLQEGIANILLVGSARTVLVAKVNKAIVKKRRAARGAIGSKAVKAPGGVGDHEKSVAGFFESILRAIVVSTRLGPPRNEQDKRTLVRAVVLASPGYWKDDLMKYISSRATAADADADTKALAASKSAFVLASATAAYRHNVLEVLAAPGVRERVADTRASHHMEALQRFRDGLTADNDKAIYGPREVAAAAERGIIEELLLVDTVMRVTQAADLVRRKTYAALCASVESVGGAVHIFSALHASGAELAKFGGVCATLRQPAPELARGLPEEVPPPPADDGEPVKSPLSAVRPSDALSAASLASPSANEAPPEWEPQTQRVPHLTLAYMNALLAA